MHPQLGLCSGGFRIIQREESVLARIQIIHTHKIHSFFYKKKDHSTCTACDCRLTVKHILSDCVDLIESRVTFFFEKVPPDSILSFTLHWSLLLIVTHFKNLVSFETKHELLKI